MVDLPEKGKLNYLRAMLTDYDIKNATDSAYDNGFADGVERGLTNIISALKEMGVDPDVLAKALASVQERSL